nr:reverse transcriptase domain-containing protein [Tanacetum cinerariifolium]
GLEDDPDSPELDPSYYDPEGDILSLEAILNSDPSPPLPNHEQSFPSFKEELKACAAKTIKYSIDEPPEVELKDLPHHLEYAFLEGDNKLPVIIAKELRSEEKAALIKVLKSHKRAIAWKLSDIQDINPKFCTRKIIMEEDYKPAVQNQRWVNPKIHDVIKKENEKLLDAGLIYLISDSPWVSPEELKACEAKMIKSSIDEPPEVELKDLPPHLEYAFLEGDNKLPVIIAKALREEEKSTLIKVLKSHKQAIAWKLSDIQEVEKLLDAGLIYPISDSPWVSPPGTLCTKKGGFTVVENEENELIPTRLVTRWWVCIDYHKLNEATRKDHFPLPFMDQMLERLARNEYYCFLDCFFG